MHNHWANQGDNYGLIWYTHSNTCFQFLNNITHISTHIFIHTYFYTYFQTTKHIRSTFLVNGPNTPILPSM